MGFPDGWCTDLVKRAAALRLCGNAVVPQAAAAAFRMLAERLTAWPSEPSPLVGTMAGTTPEQERS